MPSWSTKERLESIQKVLERTPHDQIAVGVGFKLTHDPTVCLRCRANTAIMEIGSFLHALETRSEMEVSQFLHALEESLRPSAVGVK